MTRPGRNQGGRRESRWGGGDSDTSPPRRKGGGGRDSSDESPPRRGTEKLQTKTLDGKKAGLQSAKGLKSEMEELRRREKERIGSVSLASSDMSGGRGINTFSDTLHFALHLCSDGGPKFMGVEVAIGRCRKRRTPQKGLKSKPLL